MSAQTVHGMESGHRKRVPERLHDTPAENHEGDSQDSSRDRRGEHDLPRGRGPYDAPQRGRQLHITRAHGVDEVKKEKDSAEQRPAPETEQKSTPAKQRSLQP